METNTLCCKDELYTTDPGLKSLRVEPAKLMQSQKKRNDTTDNTSMKGAADLLSTDIDTLSSTDRFVFLHVGVNSALAFLSTEGG